jgi:predicted CopG family antitoxin
MKVEYKNVRIRKDIWKTLKMKCLQEDKTISQVLESLVEKS